MLRRSAPRARARACIGVHPQPHGLTTLTGFWSVARGVGATRCEDIAYLRGCGGLLSGASRVPAQALVVLPFIRSRGTKCPLALHLTLSFVSVVAEKAADLAEKFAPLGVCVRYVFVCRKCGGERDCILVRAGHASKCQCVRVRSAYHSQAKDQARFHPEVWDRACVELTRWVAGGRGGVHHRTGQQPGASPSPPSTSASTDGELGAGPCRSPNTAAEHMAALLATIRAL